MKIRNWLKNSKIVYTSGKRVRFRHYRPSDKDIKREGRSLCISTGNDTKSVAKLTVTLKGNDINTLVKVLREAGEIK